MNVRSHCRVLGLFYSMLHTYYKPFEPPWRSLAINTIYFAIRDEMQCMRLVNVFVIAMKTQLN